MGFLDYLNEKLEGNGGNIDAEVTKYVMDALIFSAQTHIYHLLTKSYADHMAIGDFYEGLEEEVDKLAEQAIGAGLEGSEIITPSLYFVYTKETLISQVNMFKDSTTELLQKTEVPNLMNLNDVLIAIQTLCDTLLYKLQLD